MGQLIAGYGTGHILMKRGSAGESGERVFEGMRALGLRCAALQPDVLVIVSSDHLYNFDLALQAPFIVGVADEHLPFGDMKLPQTPFPGHREFAEGFVAHTAEHGFDLAKAEEYRPDHGVVLPNMLMNAQRRIPVVPLLTNVAMEPRVSPLRCWRLGAVLGDYIRDRRPAEERVVIVGSGGLSHWLGVLEQGTIAEDFDHLVLDRMTAGRAVELAQMPAEEICSRAGNGGLEIVNWLVMAAAMRDAVGEQLYYEAVGPWLTGLGGAELKPRLAAVAMS